MSETSTATPTDPTDPTDPTARTARTTYDVVVVGAGFSGLYMLHRLRGLGLSAVVLETGEDVGGTWYWNRYPGARCDVESMHYSYSFDPELEQEWEWTEKYPSQPEIHAYLRHVAERHDLRRDIRFRTTVTGARFDEAAGRWRVSTEGETGGELEARFLVTAVGCLSTPKQPEVPGLETFRGEWYHTGAWPEEHVDFSGKRVGVIGTGSSGIQLVPEVARDAASVTVFQRTPNFSVPTRNGPIDPDLVAHVRENYPQIRQEARRSGFGVPLPPPERSALEVSAEERERYLHEQWSKGSVTAVLTSYNDLLVDADANHVAAEFVRDRIREVVDDPEVAEVLCPRDFPFGTKRPCMDTGYYETFNEDHVRLVDLRRTPLESVTPAGVRTSDEEHELDALVLATGFDAMTGALLGMDIRGRDGQRLADKCRDGPTSYLGLAMAGFPNLFTITGPGSPSVLSNMAVAIEQHVEWIAAALEHLESTGTALIEADPASEAEWTDHVRESAAGTLHMEANSWYLGANVPGKPRVFMVYVGGVGVYQDVCDEVAAAGYKGFELSA
ncbi:NAD(P)/FAD-dependent oxidoreductase [Nocardioides zeae]|uniref:NAD(P)/FAD-dependent oxidoreductase n=1 Tax=Nocardioides imazamoxiresistens TaxID=3231893 RepID=A0ABU3PSX7_9ACTN|nr:NAD(P)/FAD-dependent oxidoreductase [Nocardioides zeae]MDT9592289.1 NAD(P)/FAD-dependent oxidoreductase [Nocardioides zeae]